MAKPPRVVAAEVERGQGSGAAGKLLYYETLYRLNQGFDLVLSQLQQLKKCGGLGRRTWKSLQVTVEEARAEINFELVYVLQERELRDWTYFGGLRQENDKRHADWQDFPTTANRPGTRLTSRRMQRRDQKK
jgi:hypothetical protein